MILAQRPPFTSLIRAGFLLLLVIPAVVLLAGLVSMIIHDGRTSTGHWVVLAGLLMFILISLISLARTAQRWLRRSAGISYQDGVLSFRVPVVRRFGSPIVHMQTAAVPVKALRQSRFTKGSKARLILEWDGGRLVVPARTFEVGGYSLDARIRELSQQEGGELQVVPYDHRWKLAREQPGQALGLAVVLPAFTLGLSGLLYSLDAPPVIQRVTTLFTAFAYLVAAGFVGVALTKRGTLVLDRRGIFYERNGNLWFLPDELLPTAKVHFQPEPFLFFWKRMDISHNDLTFFHIDLQQIFGIGFPLPEIARTLKDRMASAAGPQ